VISSVFVFEAAIRIINVYDIIVIENQIKRENMEIKDIFLHKFPSERWTLTVHRTSSCFGDKTFSAATTRVSNSLPSDL